MESDSRELVPVDLEREDIRKVEQYGSLIQFLRKHELVQMTTDAQQREAKRLFVIRGYRVKEVAKEVKVQPWVVNRWRNLFGWDDLRDQRLFRIHQSHSKKLSRFSPNLDKKHDNIFSSIEDQIEECIEERTVEGGQFTPQELRTLASAAESCMQSRRTIAGRANRKEEHSHSMDDSLMPGFMKLLKGLETDEGKRLGVNLEAAQDAEFVVDGEEAG